ncbi:MAG: DUF342 domain-containing protein [Planctomycetota bacterium]|jgi:uncharacterized protein (DUF342 family)
MGDTLKKIKLRFAKDGTTVLLDCDIIPESLDALVVTICNELEALGIKNIPGREKLKTQLHHASDNDPHLVEFVLIKSEPTVSLLRVTNDGMAVLLNCHINTDDLDALVDAICDELEALGIKDIPDKVELKTQLHQWAEDDLHLVDFVLIKGEPAESPKDGRVDWSGDFFNSGFILDKETGKVDYREKAANESVTKGMLLGHHVPAEKGKDGLDVYGKLLPADKPVTYYPAVGENVRFDMNKNAYYAEINGRVRLIHDVLYVDEVYIVEEDVDITTGNISHSGAIVVNRDVLNGAKIESVGDIEIHGTVENAEIRSGGNITVHGGIRQSEGHRIVAEGGIFTKYINGGDVQAKKDIVVTREIVNSTVETLGAVMIPRGRIIGGKVVALRGIFTGQTGSKVSIPTMLVAGADFSVRSKHNLRKIRIKRIETEITQLKNYIDSFMARPESASDNCQEEYMEKHAKIAEMEQELQGLIEEEKGPESKSSDRVKKLVVVHEVLFPKTIICLDYERLMVEEEINGPVQAQIVNGKIKIE